MAFAANAAKSLTVMSNQHAKSRVQGHKPEGGESSQSLQAESAFRKGVPQMEGCMISLSLSDPLL